jgi:hypothetical protein
MSFTKTLLVALVVIFSVVGTLHISSVYRRVILELKPPRGFELKWFDVPGLLLLAIVPGAMRFFVPARVERYTTIFVVVFLMTDEAITESQAKDYLQSKGIEGAI